MAWRYSVGVQRRTFLAAPLGAALLQGQTATPVARAIHELRYYRLRSGRQQQRTTDYLQRGLFPAYERAGVKPAGCFSAVIAPDTPFLMTFTTHANMAALEAAKSRLEADKDLQTVADEFNTFTELGYLRIDSYLLQGFPSFPGVTPPPPGENRAANIFEIRTYESPNEKGQRRKIQMFGEGEFDIFRRLKMMPVFAGHTIAGAGMPSLTYMLAYPDLAAREKAWAAFGSDPEWVKIKAAAGMPDPDMVSNISNSIVRPTAFSQIR